MTRFSAFAAVLLAIPLASGCRGATRTDESAAATPASVSPRTTPQPAAGKVGDDPGGVGKGTPLAPRTGHSLAAFAGGCFWGVEDAFRKVHGVTATAVGYTGGHTENATYDEVCDHGTGHAETVLVEFDPKDISYEKLLTVFLAIHDPTQLNRQGPDSGDQYRSAIFVFDDAQAKAASAAIAATQPKLDKKIVTQVVPIGKFWKAEDYHQHYAERTGHHGCPVGRIPEGI